MPRRPAVLAAAAALALSASACSRGADAEARRRVLSREGPAAPAAAAPDWEHPVDLLDLDAGEAARRLGSLDWSATVQASVTRQGDSAAQVRQAERHHLRQLSTGEFEVEAVVDDGQGPGGETGKHVIWVGDLTYARAQYAPWRQRPTDHGRDARRFREESFALAGDLARLYGPALVLTPAGEASALGRSARRFTLSLARAAPSAPVGGDGRSFGAAGPDEDTRRHLAFLDGRVPVAAAGELLLDSATGVPLKVRLAGAFGVKDDPRVRVQVELAAEVRALGEKVAAVVAPRGALPDVRRPPGVAAALEAAGLKTHEKKGEAEPADEPDAPEK